MAYDEATAARVRQALAAVDGVVEKRMFGGLVFMVNGNMCCGVDQGNLMLRVGPAQYAAALEEPYAGVMDFTGRPMRGFVIVQPAGFATAAALGEWVGKAVAFVQTLPAK